VYQTIFFNKLVRLCAFTCARRAKQNQVEHVCDKIKSLSANNTERLYVGAPQGI
jgi:hypothetical protein